MFLDSTRAGGATVVAAYSPRVRPGVPVSFPVGWDDLDDVDARRLHHPHGAGAARRPATRGPSSCRRRRHCPPTWSPKGTRSRSRGSRRCTRASAAPAPGAASPANRPGPGRRRGVRPAAVRRVRRAGADRTGEHDVQPGQPARLGRHDPGRLDHDDRVELQPFGQRWPVRRPAGPISIASSAPAEQRGRQSPVAQSRPDARRCRRPPRSSPPNPRRPRAFRQAPARLVKEALPVGRSGGGDPQRARQRTNPRSARPRPGAIAGSSRAANVDDLAPAPGSPARVRPAGCPACPGARGPSPSPSAAHGRRRLGDVAEHGRRAGTAAPAERPALHRATGPAPRPPPRGRATRVRSIRSASSSSSTRSAGDHFADFADRGGLAQGSAGPLVLGELAAGGGRRGTPGPTAAGTAPAPGSPSATRASTSSSTGRDRATASSSRSSGDSPAPLHLHQHQVRQPLRQRVAAGRVAGRRARARPRSPRPACRAPGIGWMPWMYTSPSVGIRDVAPQRSAQDLGHPGVALEPAPPAGRAAYRPAGRPSSSSTVFCSTATSPSAGRTLRM